MDKRDVLGECGWDRDKRDWENVGGIWIRGTYWENVGGIGIRGRGYYLGIKAKMVDKN